MRNFAIDLAILLFILEVVLFFEREKRKDKRDYHKDNLQTNKKIKMQFRRCGGRQIVEEKLGRHRRLELVLIALSMSHHCYITAAACSFDSFYFIFAIS